MTNQSSSVLIKSYARGALYALVVTLILVLVLALVVRLSGIGGTSIAVIVQIIKIISIFYGVGILTRVAAKHSYLHGGVLGIIYTALAFLAFSILGSSGGFAITAGFLYDMLFAIAIGACSAILLRAGRREV